MSRRTASLTDDIVADELMISGVWIALTVIVIAAGIAILRHRLYDINLIINRTLVYGTLSAGVIGCMCCSSVRWARCFSRAAI
jgi:hypothetical protein